MMLERTDTDHAPWHILPSNNKRRARLNCIAHILSLIPYKKAPSEKVELPKDPTRENMTTAIPGRTEGCSSAILA